MRRARPKNLGYRRLQTSDRREQPNLHDASTCLFYHERATRLLCLSRQRPRSHLFKLLADLGGTRQETVAGQDQQKVSL